MHGPVDGCVDNGVFPIHAKRAILPQSISCPQELFLYVLINKDVFCRNRLISHIQSFWLIHKSLFRRRNRLEQVID